MKTFETICTLAVIAYQAAAIGIEADQFSLDLKLDVAREPSQLEPAPCPMRDCPGEWEFWN